MADCPPADVIVYVCVNCIPNGGRLPRQWTQQGVRVLLREVPCTGKMDGQYLFHAFESGVRGLCVIACPKGQCQLAQGNYRAEVRIGTLRRLLGEIGLKPDRAQFLHSSPDDSAERFRQLVAERVERICELGDSPLGAKTQQAAAKR